MNPMCIHSWEKTTAFTNLISTINIGILLSQSLQTFNMTIPCSEVQGCPSILKETKNEADCIE